MPSKIPSERDSHHTICGAIIRSVKSLLLQSLRKIRKRLDAIDQRFDTLEQLENINMAKIDDLGTKLDHLAVDVAAIPKPEVNGATAAQLDDAISKVDAIQATVDALAPTQTPAPVPPAPTV